MFGLGASFQTRQRVKRLDHVQADLESLESPLHEITEMVLVSRKPQLTVGL